MNRKLYILFLIVACALSQVRAQSPPLRQCIGGKAQFAVSGDPASTFEYSVNGGVFLSTERPDSLVVQWGMQEGLFRIGVRETAKFSKEAQEKLRELGLDPTGHSCPGDWIYMLVDLKGVRFAPEQTVYTIGSSETIQITIDSKVYRTIRWADPDAVTPCPDGQPGIFHFTKPGTFQVFLEDTHGCKHEGVFQVIQR